MLPLFLSIAALSAQPARPPLPIRMPPKAVAPAGPIETALLSPVYDQPHACVEHQDGQLPFAGDALGTDCLVIGGGTAKGGFNGLYRTDGKANADWYGYLADVHAPVSGTIVGLYENKIENVPGEFGRPPATMLQIERADGVLVTLAHLTRLTVAKGDTVRAGQVVGKVGNNGMSRNPHVHVGVSRGATPLQVRWDQRAMAKLYGE